MKRLFAQGPLDRNVRAQFEHWYSDGGQSPKAIERKPGANGAYIYSGAATAWDVWQAAVAVDRETCAELCEEVGFAEHGPGREDSEAYDCADEIRMRSNANVTGLAPAQETTK